LRETLNERFVREILWTLPRVGLVTSSFDCLCGKVNVSDSRG
jgi:hypothetical protein